MQQSKVKKGKVRPLWPAPLCIACAAFFISLFFASGLSLYVNNAKYPEKVIDLRVAAGENYSYTQNGSINVSAQGSRLLFYGLNVPTKTISISLSSGHGQPFALRADVDISDESYAAAFAPADRLLLSPAGRHRQETLHFISNGKALALQLAFGPAQGSCQINTIVLNKNGFSFSFGSFFLVFFVGLALWLVLRLRLYQKVYTGAKLHHRLAVWLVLLLCIVLFALLLPLESAAAGGGLSTAYVSGAPLQSTDFYVWMFDAFMHGQATLTQPPPPQLLQMQNPYDRSLRHALGINYAYDAALYQGQYYIYYGVPPVLVYFLVYWFSGRLPTVFFACFLLCVLAMLALFFAYMQALRFFVPQANLLLVVLGYPALVFGSLLPLLFAAGDAYCPPYIFAIAAFAAFMGCALRAARTIPGAVQLVFFAAAGFSYALAVAARPPVALLGLAFAGPLFLGMLRSRAGPLPLRARQAAAFLLPVCSIAALLMAYNHLRFGSALNFGISYQLTIADMNTVRLQPPYTLWAMLYHYFFMPLQAGWQFPFLQPQWAQVLTLGNYFYAWESFGLFCLPLCWALPLGFCKTGPGQQLNPAHKQRLWRQTLALLCLAALVVAYLNFSFGGIIFRYLCDFAAPLALFAMLALLRFAAPNGAGRGVKYMAACTACTATVFVVFFICFSNWWARFYTQYPDMYISFAQFFKLS